MSGNFGVEITGFDSGNAAVEITGVESGNAAVEITGVDSGNAAVEITGVEHQSAMDVTLVSQKKRGRRSKRKKDISQEDEPTVVLEDIQKPPDGVLDNRVLRLQEERTAKYWEYRRVREEAVTTKQIKIPKKVQPINRKEVIEQEMAKLQDVLKDGDRNVPIWCAEEDGAMESWKWGEIENMVRKLKSFQQLHDFCTDNPIPALMCQRSFVTRLSGDLDDIRSWECIPEDCPVADPFPIRTESNGDCFSFAISRLVFGSKTREKEVRMRLLYEGVLNWEHYTFGDPYLAGVPNAQWYSKQDLLLAYNSCPFVSEDSSEQDKKLAAEWIQDELMKFRAPGTYAGLHFFHIAANAFGRDFISIYPTVEADMDKLADKSTPARQMREFLNRRIFPTAESGE